MRQTLPMSSLYTSLRDVKQFSTSFVHTSNSHTKRSGLDLTVLRQTHLLICSGGLNTMVVFTNYASVSSKSLEASILMNGNKQSGEGSVYRDTQNSKVSS